MGIIYNVGQWVTCNLVYQRRLTLICNKTERKYLLSPEHFLNLSPNMTFCVNVPMFALSYRLLFSIFIVISLFYN